MSIDYTENTARLESNGKEIRLLISFDVTGLNDDEKKAMLHGCLRQLAFLEKDCMGNKFKEPKQQSGIVRVSG